MRLNESDAAAHSRAKAMGVARSNRASDDPSGKDAEHPEAEPFAHAGWMVLPNHASRHSVAGHR